MKKYKMPMVELVRLSAEDIMNASGYTEGEYEGDLGLAMPSYWSLD